MERTTPALRLTRSPLVYVVLQIKTAAVVALDQFIPPIQESFRRSGFPKFIKGKIHELRLAGDSEPNVNIFDRYEFQNRHGGTGIVLSHNAIALHTNEYRTFEDFTQLFALAIRVINPVVGFGFVERVGLRYVDLIRLAEGEQFEQYVTERVLGPEPQSFGVKRVQSRFELVGSSDLGGTFAFRQWMVGNGQFLPPDLSPVTLVHKTRLDQGETVSLLDFDHYVEEQIDFDSEAVVNLAWRLHENLGRAFQSLVTPYAMARWGATNA